MTSLPPPGDGDPRPVIDNLIDPLVEPAADPTIDTRNERLDDGVNRCPQCGATDIQLRPSAGMLICLFCRHEWSEARLDETIANGDLSALRGTTIGSGASDIDTGIGSLVTMKCAGCGAEVVVNTDEQMGSRCHWCRHVLTINEQVPNGAVPDAVLPFKITHDDAMARIREFAGKRRLFADRAFVRDFTPENVVGVYMPYMVVDGNASADVAGVGEVQTRKYTRGSGDDKETFYDADVYEVQRHVDFTVDDLTIESSTERSNMDSSTNTNNIINTILPFDTENAVKWNASYLTGFTSEKRDQDVDHLVPALENQLLSIARSQVASSVDRYDRGVRWERERIDVHGSRWVAMYLPVWLYSYYHEQNGKGMVHYIAVNGRTGEVMGSVPVSHRRLLAGALAIGTIIEIFVIAILAAS
jgi:DNA-directed RNA polymerase subunit RPC12/RpoP